jgi:glycosyltransferase involved in cell wall biosynthesis
VEVLTTCAVDHIGWENSLPPGESHEEGVVVRRFETVRHGSRASLRAQLLVQEGRVPSLDDQYSWLAWNFAVPGLFHHLLRHGERYEAVVFSPYLFWTTSVCLPLVANKAVVVPCLHDEVYARLDLLKAVLAAPAMVWFLSEPEHALAHRLGPVAERHLVTGAGVEVPSRYDPEGFRRRHSIARPFVLFAGRREEGKGWNWLLDCYAQAVAAGGIEVDLVTIGVGEVSTPCGLEGRLVDLGFVSRDDRDDAFAAATAYIQPSRMESFSRTIMEAWLAGTPVLAAAGSEVVGWHCRRSGGGAIFSDADELARLLRWLTTNPAEAKAMAERGRRYVLDTYGWPVVLDRMEEALEALISEGPLSQAVSRSAQLPHTS